MIDLRCRIILRIFPNRSGRKIVGLMPLRPSRWKLNDRAPLERRVFANGKVLLMGDAARAMLPFRKPSIPSPASTPCFSPVFLSPVFLTNRNTEGAGAGQAVEDGYIRGRCLQDYFRSERREGDERGLQRWGQSCQDIRLPRAQKVARTSKHAGQVYGLQTEGMKGKS